ncbi:hypothetical protein Fmac_008443 [Flemingia macrophylla]|uniref:Uncharacterized protein n=1 Tax=Flemingia macrophylla TaxID=520843 RepID=A0ABD1MYL4_9FABA
MCFIGKYANCVFQGLMACSDNHWIGAKHTMEKHNLCIFYFEHTFEKGATSIQRCTKTCNSL